MSGFATKCALFIVFSFLGYVHDALHTAPQPLASSPRPRLAPLCLGKVPQLNPPSLVAHNPLQALAPAPSLKLKGPYLGEASSRLEPHLLDYLGSQPVSNKTSSQRQLGCSDSRQHLHNSSQHQLGCLDSRQHNSSQRQLGCLDNLQHNSSQLQLDCSDSRQQPHSSSHSQTYLGHRCLGVPTLPTKTRNSKGRDCLGVRIISSSSNSNRTSRLSVVGDPLLATQMHCNRKPHFPLAATRGAHHCLDSRTSHRRTLHLALLLPTLLTLCRINVTCIPSTSLASSASTTPTGAPLFTRSTKFNDLPDQVKKSFEDIE